MEVPSITDWIQASAAVFATAFGFAAFWKLISRNIEHEESINRLNIIASNLRDIVEFNELRHKKDIMPYFILNNESFEDHNNIHIELINDGNNAYSLYIKDLYKLGDPYLYIEGLDVKSQVVKKGDKVDVYVTYKNSICFFTLELKFDDIDGNEYYQTILVQSGNLSIQKPRSVKMINT